MSQPNSTTEHFDRIKLVLLRAKTEDERYDEDAPPSGKPAAALASLTAIREQFAEMERKRDSLVRQVAAYENASEFRTIGDADAAMVRISDRYEEALQQVAETERQLADLTEDRELFNWQSLRNGALTSERAALTAERDHLRADLAKEERGHAKTINAAADGLGEQGQRIATLVEALREIENDALEGGDALPHRGVGSFSLNMIGAKASAALSAAPQSNAGSPASSLASSPDTHKSGVEALELEICLVDREAIFVCGVWGRVTSGIIEQIEADLHEESSWIPEGLETVRVTAAWSEPEYGEYGRVEIPGYWDLNISPLAQLKPDQEANPAAREHEHAAPPQSAPPPCPNCGHDVQPAWCFCANCGETGPALPEIPADLLASAHPQEKS